MTQAIGSEAYEGGFASPVFDAQSVFRSLMEAMARPGSIWPVTVRAGAPDPLGPTMAALLLTLCDADTPVWLDAAASSEKAVAAWLGFHTGAPVVDEASEAAFAVVVDGLAIGAIERFAQGTQDYPDRSTTLLVQVESLTDGRPLTLEGPGIRTRASIAPRGLPDRMADIWAGNNALFPRGVDMVLAAPDAIAALARTTRIVRGGN